MRMLEILIILLVGGVVFVNGWTDAPNAITGVVATKTLSYRRAVGYAALCNLAGLIVMSLVNASVADTITSMVDFSAGSTSESLAALASAMVAIVIFAVSAWYFGIPTSESHALIAALTGAAVALGGGFSAVSAASWKKTLLGLAISLVMGFLLGLAFSKTLGGLLKNLPERLLDRFQIISAGIMAFMHGAQDGQKFIAVFVIAELLVKGRYNSGAVNIREHMLTLVFCAVLIAAGTSAGGKRIIDTVGNKMTTLKKPQSVCADLGSGLCLFLASLSGIPMSTTHTKTSAIMGASLTLKKNPAGLKIAGEMLLAWVITFPVCGALGFLLTKLAVSMNN